MKIIIVLATALLVSSGLFKPACIWDKQVNNFEAVPATTEITIPKSTENYKFTVMVETSDGKEFPMFVEGITRSGNNNPQKYIRKPIPAPGWEPKGVWGWKEDVYIYASVEMKEDVNLKYITLTNGDNYVRRIELDKFFQTDHKFAKGDKYGVGIPL